MHICIVCNEYPPCKHGGIGSFTKDLAEGLVEKGHKVSIIGIYHKRELDFEEAYNDKINGVDVYRYPMKNKFKFHKFDLIDNRLYLYKEIRKLHENYPIDVLEAPDFDGWLPLGTPEKIPFVSRLHGGVTFLSSILRRKISVITRFLEKHQLKKSDLIVSVSKHTADTTCSIFKLTKGYKVIYNSIKMPALLPEQKIQKGLILFYGSVTPKKGLTELVKAFDKVAQKFDEARLVIAGKNNDTQNGMPYDKYLLSLILEKNRGKIIFTGPLDREKELFPMVMRANICCFPSHVEAFALAPLEAMSMGKAVLFTIYASGPEAIEDGVSGVLADTKDPNSIASKIMAVLENDSLANELGKNAKKRIEENFSYKNWIEENSKMFESFKRAD